MCCAGIPAYGVQRAKYLALPQQPLERLERAFLRRDDHEPVPHLGPQCRDEICDFKRLFTPPHWPQAPPPIVLIHHFYSQGAGAWAAAMRCHRRQQMSKAVIVIVYL